MEPMTSDETLAARLRNVFGDRLKMVATFGSEPSTCAVVDSMTIDDLDKCARTVGGKNPPLLMLTSELTRAMDAFPLELNEINATRRLVEGTDLFGSMHVPVEEVRRACEVQARGHLVHLREAYVEAAGDKKAIARLLSASVAPFRALLANVARLDGTTVAELSTRLQLEDADFPHALRAAERLVDYIDRWKRA